MHPPSESEHGFDEQAVRAMAREAEHKVNTRVGSVKAVVRHDLQQSAQALRAVAAKILPIGSALLDEISAEVHSIEKRLSAILEAAE